MAQFWRDMTVASGIMVLFLFIHLVDLPPVNEVQARTVTPIELPEYVPTAPQFSAREIQCMRNAIYGEARGESRDVQVAVAATIINRSLNGAWPTDLCDVVKQKNQFHGYKAVIHLNNEQDVQSWDLALDAANHTASNYYMLPHHLQKTLYFHSGGDIANWSSRLRVAVQLGRMTFYA